MIKNYFKIAWRNLLKNKAFSAINIIGLAIGMAACIIIMLFVFYEQSFDSVHSKNIYRLDEVQKFEGMVAPQNVALSMFPMGPTLKNEFPEIRNFTRIAGIKKPPLSIIISCLGLFGLVSYSAERRVKEIGIRKVLGATVQNVVLLLSRDFIKLVLIANMIAWPIAWFALSKWLQDFAYRVNISWWVFIAAGISAVLIALLTISFQAIKAAVANPVKSLRAE